MEANKLADEKGLKVGVGLQRRHDAGYHRDGVEKIHDGRLRQAHPLAGLLERRRHLESAPPSRGMTEMEYQVNNWYHFCWLSGDNICEQHIHNLDICNWVMDDHPVEANGMGGCTAATRARQKGTGQIFDHHFVEFTYEDGIQALQPVPPHCQTWGRRASTSTGRRAIPACRGGQQAPRSRKSATTRRWCRSTTT